MIYAQKIFKSIGESSQVKSIVLYAEEDQMDLCLERDNRKSWNLF